MELYQRNSIWLTDARRGAEVGGSRAGWMPLCPRDRARVRERGAQSSWLSCNFTRDTSRVPVPYEVHTVSTCSRIRRRSPQILSLYECAARSDLKEKNDVDFEKNRWSTASKSLLSQLISELCACWESEIYTRDGRSGRAPATCRPTTRKRTRSTLSVSVLLKEKSQRLWIYHIIHNPIILKN